MKTAKILEIGKPREWEWPHGRLYYIPLKLDNGENISLGKKKEDAFKVGDTVSYEVVDEWKKWREVTENNYKPKASNPDNNVWAMIGMAMKLAFEHMYDKKNYTETYQLAVRIFEDSMQLFDTYTKGKSESKIEDSTENDNLPF